MPKIKNTFALGKMNKDLDERLVPNGEYRDAMNIQVSTSEESNVGTVQNILGNIKLSDIDEIYSGADNRCVGSIADEKNDKLYWFTTTTQGDDHRNLGDSHIRKDLILEWDGITVNNVFTDIWRVYIKTQELSALNDGTTTSSSPGIPSVSIPIGGYQQEFLQSVWVGMELTLINSNTNTYITEDNYVLAVDRINGVIYLRDNIDISTTITSSHELLFRPPGNKRVLNFDKDNLITGINIIDDLLFWTDNISEPKKIDINRSKEGTINDLIHTKIINRERDYISLGNTDYIAVAPFFPTWPHAGIPAREHHVSVIKKSPISAPNLKMFGTGQQNISCFAYKSSNNANSTNFEEGSTNNPKDPFTVHRISVYNTHATKPLDWSVGDVLLLKATDASSGSTPSPNLLPVTDYDIRAIIDSETPAPYDNTGGVDKEIQFWITIQSINGETPLGTDLVFAVSKEEKEEKLFDDKFVRFAYRWKYIDGEYSCFSPFSETAFLPGAYDHHPTKGYNKAMSSTVYDLRVQDFITPDMPEDVVEVDLLYKDTVGTNVYVVDTFKYKDTTTANYTSPVSGSNLNVWNDYGSAWHSYQNNIDTAGTGITLDQLENNVKISGSYQIKSETIFKALPANQLLRAFDSVPKKALAQEIVGNRLVYANYLQNYDTVNRDNKDFKLKFGSFHPVSYDPTGEERLTGQKSIKSLREYQIGVSYMDEYGRETPVFTDDTGSTKVSKSKAADYNRLKVKINGPQPLFAQYFKFYIKESSNEYYNLVQDRIYDAEDGNVWLSFPSADRNKIDEDTYIILKKGNGAKEFVEEQAKYKVLAISGQAPDFIKETKKLIGKISLQNESVTFPQTEEQNVVTQDVTIENADSFTFKIDENHEKCDRTLIDIHENTHKKKIRFVSNDNSSVNPNNQSKYHEIATVTKDGDDTGVYHIVLKNHIDTDPGTTANKHFTFDDANSRWIGVDASGNVTNPGFLEFYEYPVENKPEFDGRFFVKIHNDAIIANNFAKEADPNELQAVASQPVYLLNNSSGSQFATFTGYSTSLDGVNSTNTNQMDVYYEWENALTALNTDGFWFIDETNFYAPTTKQGSKHKVSEDYTHTSGVTEYPDNLDGIGTIRAGYLSGDDETLNVNKGIRSSNTYASAFSTQAAIPIDSVTGLPAQGSIDISFVGIDSDNFELPAAAQRFADKFREGNYIKIGTDTDIYKIVAIKTETFANYNKKSHQTDNTGVSNVVKFKSQRRKTFRLHLAQAIGEGDNNTAWSPSTDSIDFNTSRGLTIFSPFVAWDEENAIDENPAIWETEPKEDIDLDVYYEASNEIPIYFTEETAQLFIPIGSIVTAHDNLGTANTNFADSTLDPDTSPTTNKMIVTKNERGKLTVSNVNNGGNLILQDKAILIIEHPVTGIKMAVSVEKAPEQTTALASSGYNGTGTNYYYKDVDSFYISTNYNGSRELDWSNCYSYGNGVESDRIRDGFNLPRIGKGVKVSSITESPYKEEHRKNGLIFSGIYNSKTGINNTNQFISGEKITKDVNPSYGSIQKLHTRDSDLITLCEDKCLKILANKDAIYNADGNPQLTANERVLGQTIPFVGDYGISTNPESFATEAYRMYFTDKVRGKVIRLSRDGLTAISEYGMRDWFRDNLKDCDVVLGSYDDYKNEYNITLKSGKITNATTVSFKESINGFVSFKSFIPEDALSMGGQYYSFRKGQLFQHHSESGSYNTFYQGINLDPDDEYKLSSITFLMNEIPDSVKNFKTIGYEGSQGRVIQNHQDNEYYNTWVKDGWMVENITTDHEDGSVPEFVEKEGKWFNYIKGKNAETVSAIQTDQFNFQGIGIANSISGETPNYTLTIRDLNDDD